MQTEFRNKNINDLARHLFSNPANTTANSTLEIVFQQNLPQADMQALSNPVSYHGVDISERSESGHSRRFIRSA